MYIYICICMYMYIYICVHTCTYTTSDWLALAALKCFTEWVDLCAKEGGAHMAQAHHGQPSCYRRCALNVPA